MNDKPLPCPFCGSPADPRGWGNYCRCSNKDCILGGSTNGHLIWIDIDKWNARMSPETARQISDMRKTIEQLKKRENKCRTKIKNN